MKIKKKHLYFVAVILVVIVILLLLRCCGSGESIGIDDESVPLGGIEWDADAEEGELTQRSEEEIQAELNKKVAQGMINISMNTAPVFPSGTEKGNLNIVNSERNNYPQVVYIVRKDTGEEIYRSGGIPVGSKIERAALAVDLPAGIYDCVAYFNSIDAGTGAILGTAGAEITVTVQN